MRYILLAIGVFLLIIGAFMTFYIVPEGHVAVVKFTGKADRVVQPGFHSKWPFLETTETFEIRERKNAEEMAAATANQLPATAIISMNWTVNRDAAMDLFIKYGGLAQFEERVLDPRMRSASKAAISRYRADQIIRERQRVVAEIHHEIALVTETLPIAISNVQLENISLPQQYLDSILAKEKAREDAEREKHTLAQQKLRAQQEVQTAEAERDARKAKADGQAYEKRTLAEAEAYSVRVVYEGRAEGIQALKAQITDGYIDYLKAQTWNGQLPQTMMGGDVSALLGLKQ